MGWHSSQRTVPDQNGKDKTIGDPRLHLTVKVEKNGEAKGTFHIFKDGHFTTGPED